MRIFFIFFFNFFFYSTLFSQSFLVIKVIDNESNAVIPNARLLYGNEVSYTNDDGDASIPSEVKEIVVSANSYQEIKVKLPTSIVKLPPIYNQIEEVKIQNFDMKILIEKVLSNYDNKYLTNPTMYLGTYKNKSVIDESIHKLLVADMSIWTLNNKYVRDKNIDKYIQIGINGVRFYRNRKTESDYPFSRKGVRDKNDINAFLQRIFMYNQLYIMLFYTKNLKINGKIINETNDIQEISFKSDKMQGDVQYYVGKVIYNKNDNAITFLEVNHIQSNAIRKYQNTFNEDIETNTTSFRISYDFIKKKEKYVITKINVNYLADLVYKSKMHSVVVSEEFVFQNSQENKKGITDKIDISKDIVENLSDKDIKENKVLLSKEEQKFIDEQ